jgi:hypothetical protein
MLGTGHNVGIEPVNQVARDGGDYVIRCPHCQQTYGIEGDDLSEITGGQYQHRSCGGWAQVNNSAAFKREI